MIYAASSVALGLRSSDVGEAQAVVPLERAVLRSKNSEAEGACHCCEDETLELA